MDIKYQLTELDNDLIHLVDYNRNRRNSLLENCNSVIDTYLTFYQHYNINYLKSLRSIVGYVDKLDFSSDSYIDLSIINQVLIDFAKVYQNSIIKDYDHLQSLDFIISNAQQNIRKNIEENRINSCNFNPLKFFNIDEPLHSRLILKLLNPNSEHGQGKLFLIEFLKLLEIDVPEKGEWKVTAETGRIDILLKRTYPESIIIIENKSNRAVDQQNQLYRYWHQEIYLRTKKVDAKYYVTNRNRYKIIYMPSDFFKYPEIHSIFKPKDENWSKLKELPEKMPIEYEIKTFNGFIVQWIALCIEILPESNNRMREYLKQYIEICNNL